MERLKNYLVACLLASTTISLPSFGLDGVVMDDAANRPIAGAFVVARWTGSMGLAMVASQTVCYQVEHSRTDANGRFNVRELSGNVNPLISDRRQIVQVYAPGYEVGVVGKSKAAAQTRLRKRAGSASEQYEKFDVPTGIECVESDEKRVLPILMAARAELGSLASTVEQRRKVLDWDHAIDVIELGEKEAGERHGRRLQDFLQRETNPK